MVIGCQRLILANCCIILLWANKDTHLQETFLLGTSEKHLIHVKQNINVCLFVFLIYKQHTCVATLYYNIGTHMQTAHTEINDSQIMQLKVKFMQQHK